MTTGGTSSGNPVLPTPPASSFLDVAELAAEHARLKTALKGVMPGASENKLDEVATNMAYDSLKARAQPP